MVDVIKCCLDSIRHISDDIKDAIVYLDAGSTECFEFLGAFSLLFELGAHAICSLEKVSPLDKMAHSAYPDSPLGPDAFPEYESLLVQDYEELLRRSQVKCEPSGESLSKESVAPEDEEGWSPLATSAEHMSEFDPISSLKGSEKDTVMGKASALGSKLVVSVHHFPLVLCPFSPRFFVLPSEGSVAEAYLSTEQENSISRGLPPISTGIPPDGEDIPPGATLTAQFLYHLATKMDLKLEIFSLGDFSKTVGKLLTDMSSLYDVGRRKRSAGLLIIDRTLDLLTPCCHGDSLVDQFFSSLPRRERTASLGTPNQLKFGPTYLQRAPLNVLIPLETFIKEESSTGNNSRLVESIEAFLSGWNSTSEMTDSMDLSAKLNEGKSLKSVESDLLCGSFVSTDNYQGTPYLEAILDRRTKDGTVLIKKWLQEALRREKISLNMKISPGYASKSELQAMIRALAKSQSSLMKNKGIIQLAIAALYVLAELHSARWNAFNSAEKILAVNARDTSQSLAAQISDLINKSALVGVQETTRGLLTLHDALLLAVNGYILAGENFPTSGSSGPFSWQEEHFIKESIVDAIVENPAVAKLKFLQGLTEELEANLNKRKQEEKEEGLDQAENIDFGDEEWSLALESKFSDDPYSNKGMLYKVLSRVLEKQDIPGLEYHSSTVGRLFKSGFGRFGLGQAKPSLADQNIILVFVVGGINGVEVREAQEALSESTRPDIDLILGGTTLLTPNDMFELLLGESGYI
nr:sec1 family domain-containing protein MIP3 [Ipomoea batatas]